MALAAQVLACNASDQAVSACSMFISMVDVESMIAMLNVLSSVSKNCHTLNIYTCCSV